MFAVKLRHPKPKTEDTHNALAWLNTLVFGRSLVQIADYSTKNGIVRVNCFPIEAYECNVGSHSLKNLPLANYIFQKMRFCCIHYLQSHQSQLQ